MAEAFEASDIHNNTNDPVTYDALIKELKDIMSRHEIRVNSRKDVQCKRWWDTEVKDALKARQQQIESTGAPFRTSQLKIASRRGTSTWG